MRQIPYGPSIRLIYTPYSLTVTMMSRITLHLKRFAHRTTDIDTEDPRWHVSRHRRPSAPPYREMSRLEAPPRAAFPPRWSTALDSPDDFFPLQSLSSTGSTRPEISVVGPSVPIELDALAAVGEEGLAGSRRVV